MSETGSRWKAQGMVALAAWLLLVAATLAAAAASGGALDGKRFVGSIGPQGGKADGAETVTFAGGRFRSLACDAYGFGDVPYTTTTTADGGVRFHAVTESAKEGRIEWDGTVRDGGLDGTFVWTKGGASRPYWVRATLQAAAKGGQG